MLKLTKKMKAAIKQYFKMKYWDGTGLFPQGGAKAECIEQIKLAAEAGKYSWMVVPGLIALTKGKQTRYYAKECWWIGRPNLLRKRKKL